eukprot:EG_transcript_37495
MAREYRFAGIAKHGISKPGTYLAQWPLCVTEQGREPGAATQYHNAPRESLQRSTQGEMLTDGREASRGQRKPRTEEGSSGQRGPCPAGSVRHGRLRASLGGRPYGYGTMPFT